jgi:hypothetical protein
MTKRVVLKNGHSTKDEICRGKCYTPREKNNNGNNRKCLYFTHICALSTPLLAPKISGEKKNLVRVYNLHQLLTVGVEDNCMNKA